MARPLPLSPSIMRIENLGSGKVLVIARALRPRVRQAIREHGLRPVEASTLTETIARLRGRPFAAMVIDPRNTIIDPLEMVLTVRDYDSHMPVMLLRGNGDNRVPAPLLAQPAFSIVPVSELNVALQRVAQTKAELETA